MIRREVAPFAAERPEVFKAVGSIIGTMSGYTWEHREDIKPVPVLQISGLDDRIVPVDGSMRPAGGWGGAPDKTNSRWCGEGMQ